MFLPQWSLTLAVCLPACLSALLLSLQVSAAGNASQVVTRQLTLTRAVGLPVYLYTEPGCYLHKTTDSFLREVKEQASCVSTLTFIQILCSVISVFHNFNSKLSETILLQLLTEPKHSPLQVITKNLINVQDAQPDMSICCLKIKECCKTCCLCGLIVE